MIEVRNLTKVYGASPAIENVSFSVQDGDILGFLGPNGAGKSTTMRILTCYTPPTSGDAAVAGFDIRSQSMEVRRSVGYLPESNPLYPDMTVEGYLQFAAELKGLPRSMRRGAVDEALDETGLGDTRRRLLRNLSKGFRQRVGLAQALVGNPRVLILDEPTVGLDPAQNREIRSLIRAMLGRRTVLLSTHILPEVSMTWNKVVIINRGRIEASGTPENLMNSMQETIEVRVIAAGKAEPLEKALGAIEGVRAVRPAESLILENAPKTGESAGAEGPGARLEWLVELDRRVEARPAIARAVLEAGGDLYELRTQGVSLEDIFLRVVSRERAETAGEEENAAA